MSHLTSAVGVAEPVFLAELGLPADHPMVKIVRAVVGAAIGEYLNTVPSIGVTQEHHQDFMRYVRAMITAAQAPKAG
jgi:hypothetical protein